MLMWPEWVASCLQWRSALVGFPCPGAPTVSGEKDVLRVAQACLGYFIGGPLGRLEVFHFFHFSLSLALPAI